MPWLKEISTSLLSALFVLLALIILVYPANAGYTALENGANITNCTSTSMDIRNSGYFWVNTSIQPYFTSAACISIQSSDVVLTCTPNTLYAAGIDPRQYYSISALSNATSTSHAINITVGDNARLKNITIQNCTIWGFSGLRGSAVQVSGAVDRASTEWGLILLNNTITNNTNGVNITGGNVTNAHAVGGINLTGNNFVNNSRYHVYLNISSTADGAQFFNRTNIIGNNFTGGFVYYIAGLALPVAGLYFFNGSNSTIYKNNFSNLTNALILWNITASNITENNFSFINRTAIGLYASADNFNGTNNISNNTIFNVSTIADVWGTACPICVNSSNNTISFNLINLSNHSGINVTLGGNFTNITSNVISNVSSVGIALSQVVGGNVSGNNITFVSAAGGTTDANTRGYGIWISQSNFTQVVYNFINYSNLSIRVTSANFTNITNNTFNNTVNNTAILIDGPPNTPSNYNVTIANNIIGNTTYSSSLTAQFGAISVLSTDGTNVTNNIVINTTGVHGIVVNASLAANVSHNTLRQVNATWNNINISGVDNLTLIRNDIQESGQDGIVINGSNSPNVFYNTILSAGRDALALYNLTMGNFSENNLSTSSSGIRAGLLGSNNMQVNDSLFQNNNVTGNSVGLNLTQIIGSRFENTRIWNNTAAQQRFGNANITHYNVSVNVTNVSIQAALNYYNVSYIHYVNVTVFDGGGAFASQPAVEFISSGGSSILTANGDVVGNASLNLTIANQSGTDTTLSTTNFSAMNFSATLGVSQAGYNTGDMAVGQFDGVKSFTVNMIYLNGANVTSCVGSPVRILNPGNYWFNTTGGMAGIDLGAFSYHAGNCISIQTSNVVFSCTPNPIYDVGAGGISRLQYFTIGTRGNNSATSVGINITSANNGVLQNITIQNCTVTGWNGTTGAGILINGHAWNVSVANVTFVNNTVGLNVTGGNVTSVSPVGNLNVTRNHFTNNSLYHLVINISSAPSTSTYFNITNITVNNFTQGNFTHNVYGKFIAAIFLANGSNSTIYRNNFSNLTNGIVGWNLTRFNITENNLSLINKTAVGLYSSVNAFNGTNNISNNTIWGINVGTNFWAGGAWGEAAGIKVNNSNNTISFNVINVSNHSGINVTLGANFTNVSNNNVTNVTSAGISVWDSAGSNVSGNRIFNVSSPGDPAGATSPRGYGIWIHRSNFTHVVYNVISAANITTLVNFTNTTNVTNNTFNSTWNGSGVYILGSSSYPTTNITISYNVIGNTTASASLLQRFAAIYSLGIDSINIANNFIINTSGADGIAVANGTQVNVSHNDLRFVNATFHAINLSAVDNATIIRNDIRETGLDGIIINGSAGPDVFYNTILGDGSTQRFALSLFNVSGANVSENNLSLYTTGLQTGWGVDDASHQVNNSLFQNNNVTGNSQFGLNLTRIIGSRFENTRIWNNTVAQQRFGNTNITHYNVSVNVTNVSMQAALNHYNVSYIHYVNVTVRDKEGALAQSALVEFYTALTQTITSGYTNAQGNLSLNLTMMNQSNTGATLVTDNFSGITASATYSSQSGSAGLSDAAVGQFDALKTFAIRTAASGSGAAGSGGGGGGGPTTPTAEESEPTSVASPPSDSVVEPSEQRSPSQGEIQPSSQGEGAQPTQLGGLPADIGQALDSILDWFREIQLPGVEIPREVGNAVDSVIDSLKGVQLPQVAIIPSGDIGNAISDLFKGVQFPRVEMPYLDVSKSINSLWDSLKEIQFPRVAVPSGDLWKAVQSTFDQLRDKLGLQQYPAEYTAILFAVILIALVILILIVVRALLAKRRK